jgi:hypothetical protein
MSNDRSVFVLRINNTTLLKLHGPEDEVTTIIRNGGNCPPRDTQPHMPEHLTFKVQPIFKIKIQNYNKTDITQTFNSVTMQVRADANYRLKFHII